MTSFADSSGSLVTFHVSTCFRIGSKFRCMRSTPTERMSTRLRCLVWVAGRPFPDPPLFSLLLCLDQPVPCTFSSPKVSSSRGGTPLTLLRRSSKVDLNITVKRDRWNFHETFLAVVPSY